MRAAYVGFGRIFQIQTLQLVLQLHSSGDMRRQILLGTGYRKSFSRLPKSLKSQAAQVRHVVAEREKTLRGSQFSLIGCATAATVCFKPPYVSLYRAISRYCHIRESVLASSVGRGIKNVPSCNLGRFQGVNCVCVCAVFC